MPLLQELKTQTAACHSALEKQMDMLRHFQNRSDYVRLLERFFGLYEPLEQQLANCSDWGQQGWNFDSRRKTAWLDEDLRFLGLSENDRLALPRCTELPEPASTAEALGCLYVLEGSTLGGQVISRLLSQQLEVMQGNGGRFFNGYGPETGPHWRQFGQWAEKWATDHPGQEGDAVQGARKTFDCFARWFH